MAAPRDSRDVYRPKGQLEPDRFLHVTCGILESDALHARAKALGVTVEELLEDPAETEAKDEGQAITA